MIAAGVAFYALLAMVPAISGFAGLYALVVDEVPSRPFDETIVTMLPDQTRAMLVDQLDAMRATPSTALTVGVVVALVITLWSASAAMKHLLDALALRGERSGYVRTRLVGFGLTVGLVVFLVVALAATAAVPALLDALEVGSTIETLLSLLQWPLAAGAMLLMTAAIFWFARDGASERQRVFSLGVWTATVLWLVGSVGFSAVVGWAPRIHTSYGSFASVAVTMLWFWLFGAALQLGALTDRARAMSNPLGRAAEPPSNTQHAL